MFQSTPPREGRPSSTLAASRQHCFNPRPHREGRRWPRATPHCRPNGFNPRPTRGATKIRLRAALRLVVSIHAPARGATEREVLFLTSGKFQSTPPRGGATELLAKGVRVDLVFQSTPPRGGRLTERPRLNQRLSFNPRPHAGGDDRQRVPHSWVIAVSIHAPTRGATTLSKLSARLTVVSIHAPTRGATYNL